MVYGMSGVGGGAGGKVGGMSRGNVVHELCGGRGGHGGWTGGTGEVMHKLCGR